MKGKLHHYLLLYGMILVEIMSTSRWVCVTSKPFPPPEDVAAIVVRQGTEQYPQSLQFTRSPKEGTKSMEGRDGEAEEGASKIGSSPPSCAHKCHGCMPCEAIQVPTTTSRLGVQYTNYEPEGWKCKCGPTFYSP